jgi:mRNA interferase HigB
MATGGWMHVISKRPFSEAARGHPNHATSLERVYRALKKGNFATPDAMRRIFPSLDNFKYQSKWWVIDIAGNTLRLIAFIQFSQNRIYVKHIVTHADYDKLSRRYVKGELN